MSATNNPSSGSASNEWDEALAEQAGAGDAATKQKAPEKNDYQPAQFSKLQPAAGAKLQEGGNLDIILDIPVNISMEIGRTVINIRNLLQLNQGSVVELDRLAGEPMDVLVNGTLIAHGEVVVVNEKFGIRLTDVISPAERVQKLK